jgi:hypothetical protein
MVDCRSIFCDQQLIKKVKYCYFNLYKSEQLLDRKLIILSNLISLKEAILDSRKSTAIKNFSVVSTTIEIN